MNPSLFVGRGVGVAAIQNSFINGSQELGASKAHGEEKGHKL